MRLDPDQPAVDFVSEDFRGDPVRLKDYRGKRTLLTFFRYAACPFCNLRVHDLITHFSELDAQGLSIIAVFESSRKNISEYVGKQDAPFPLVPDPGKKLYTSYGLEKSVWGLLKPMSQPSKAYRAMVTEGFRPKLHKIDGAIHRMPADFLLDGTLMIRNAYYGTDIGDHIPVPVIRDFLKRP